MESEAEQQQGFNANDFTNCRFTRFYACSIDGKPRNVVALLHTNEERVNEDVAISVCHKNDEFSITDGRARAFHRMNSGTYFNVVRTSEGTLEVTGKGHAAGFFFTADPTWTFYRALSAAVTAWLVYRNFLKRHGFPQNRFRAGSASLQWQADLREDGSIFITNAYNDSGHFAGRRVKQFLTNPVTPQKKIIQAVSLLNKRVQKAIVEEITHNIYSSTGDSNENENLE